MRSTAEAAELDTRAIWLLVGQNAIELDTAAGDTLPVLCIVSLKAGRTASPQAATE